MSLFDEPKIDCHNHLFDPARFPYPEDAFYRPAGHEIGTADYFKQVLDAYGVRYALVVEPNSGYGPDNRCLLDAIATSGGRFKGMAVVGNDVATSELERLKAAGMLGITYNVALHGVERYANTEALLAKLAALDLFVQVQVERDQLIALAPMLERSGVRMLFDHCGRPAPEAGVEQRGFQALLRLARTQRAFVKLSGHVKFSHEAYPHADTLPFVRALIDAFTLDACVWGSDWPFLRAPARVDYGTLLTLIGRSVPEAADRRKLFWDTPRRLFGFAD